MSTVSAILVSRDSAGYMDRCLRSLASQEGVAIEPVLVDNGSRDDSVTRYLRHYPEGKVLRQDTNLGFARGTNLGIEATRGELVLLLNTDCFLEPGYLRRLADRLALREDLAGVQGRYLLEGRQDIVDSLGIEIRITGVARDIGRGRPDRGEREPVEVDALCAAAALFRRSALESVREEGHVLDPDFFSYYEDVDLCWRLRRRGYRFECVPAATALHVRGGSVTREGAMHRLALRNRYLTLAKNLPGSSLLLRLPVILGRELLKIPWLCVRHPGALPGYLDILRDLPLFFRKRKAHG
jgi:GT2 family glycosyltransferase